MGTDLGVHGAAIADLRATAGSLRPRAICIGEAAIELGLELHSIGREHAGHGHRRSRRASTAGQLRSCAGCGIVLLLQLLPAHLPALCQCHIPAESWSQVSRKSRLRPDATDLTCCSLHQQQRHSRTARNGSAFVVGETHMSCCTTKPI